MADRPLRVLPRGTGRVPDYEAQESGIRKSVGWRHDRTLGPEFVDPSTNETRNHGGFVRHSNIVTVPHRVEYIRALREYSLWPADEETARAANVAFDATFGGEHPAVRTALDEALAPARDAAGLPTSFSPSAE